MGEIMTMDKARIEEFRKKLRQGRPVRVVNGRIMLEEEAPDQEKTEQTQTHPPKPQGVKVKPHEWGSDRQHLVATTAGQERALKERALLQQEYPDFVMDIEDDGLLYVHGWLGGTNEVRNRYHVIITIPPGYGRGVMPFAHVLEPKLRDKAPHTYTDGSLCLDHSGSFNERSTLVTFLAWVCVWLALYEGWCDTGRAW